MRKAAHLIAALSGASLLLRRSGRFDQYARWASAHCYSKLFEDFERGSSRSNHFLSHHSGHASRRGVPGFLDGRNG